MPEIFNSTKTPVPAKKHNKPNVTKHRHLPSKDALPGYTKNPLSAYCYYPDHVSFIGADKEEKIVLLLRKHAITNVPWILIAILMLASPVVLWSFGFLETIPFEFLTVGLLFWYLISFAFILEEFLSWFFNVYIVTDERVFDVDFINLVYREITDANLEQIQDVTVRVGSVIRTLFDYGDVIIQTAGVIPQLDFEAVPHPDLVAQVLRELRVEEEVEKLEGRVR